MRWNSKDEWRTCKVQDVLVTLEMKTGETLKRVIEGEWRWLDYQKGPYALDTLEKARERFESETFLELGNNEFWNADEVRKVTFDLSAPYDVEASYTHLGIKDWDPSHWSLFWVIVYVLFMITFVGYSWST